ncbi:MULTISPECIES: hypothetical protein [unclassified Nitratiruptor]|uniref:hypothetical protein n=1 Tax=unclassified Nitratiruptor TaxID=2624044 RepID=UPI0019155767|nr:MULTISPECIES: hypothetical protein [unclassified Nitratiruptor]BCD60987.1 hypothetical protein NitYY0810_C1768 [Nitratiruptor sp. YY08-10]BCD64919.1 hypothetical protein NitYY0814_C1776 [Nitratiruptor sp. YY08-14]
MKKTLTIMALLTIAVFGNTGSQNDKIDEEMQIMAVEIEQVNPYWFEEEDSAKYQIKKEVLLKTVPYSS